MHTPESPNARADITLAKYGIRASLAWQSDREQAAPHRIAKPGRCIELLQLDAVRLAHATHYCTSSVCIVTSIVGCRDGCRWAYLLQRQACAIQSTTGSTHDGLLIRIVRNCDEAVLCSMSRTQASHIPRNTARSSIRRSAEEGLPFGQR